jgi:site-specific DNA recombinase
MSNIKAAIYARFSTDLQSDRSIEDQFAVCDRYAAENCMEVVHRFEDRAKSSATLFGRDGLLSLVEAAKRGDFRVIVVEALDRISRNPADLHGLFQTLEFAGVSIEEISRGKADAMTVGLSSLMGQMFLQGLKEKTRRGLAGVVRDGRSAGGKAYGYEPVPGRPGELSIVEHEARIVRRIFDEYVSGSSTREIAAKLNEERIPSPRGRLWRASILTGNRARHYGILMNDIYNGERIWNRVRMVRDPETGKRVSRSNPENQWQRHSVPDLRIVPESVWERAQLRLNDSRWLGRGHNKKPKRPLSGLIKCGHCGNSITIRARRKNGAVYMACTGATELGICKHRSSLRMDKIESDVLDRLASLLHQPAYLQAYLNAYHHERLRLMRLQTKDRATLQRRLANAESNFARAEHLYLERISDGEDAIKRLRELKVKLLAARKDLADFTPPENLVSIRPEATKRYLDALKNLAPSLMELCGPSADSAIHTLRELISEVQIFRSLEEIEVKLYGHIGALLPQSSRLSEKNGSVRRT